MTVVTALASILSAVQAVWVYSYKNTQERNAKLTEADKAADKARLTALELKTDANALAIATHLVRIDGLKETHDELKRDLGTKFERLEVKIDRMSEQLNTFFQGQQ